VAGGFGSLNSLVTMKPGARRRYGKIQEAGCVSNTISFTVMMKDKVAQVEMSKEADDDLRR